MLALVPISASVSHAFLWEHGVGGFGVCNQFSALSIMTSCLEHMSELSLQDLVTFCCVG